MSIIDEKTGMELKEILKNKKVLFAAATIVVILALVLLIKGCGKGNSLSEDEIATAALSEAERDYGYKLTLKSCEVVDTFSGRKTWTFTGEKVDVNLYGVLLKADANDSEGNTVESLKYEVLVQQWDRDNNIMSTAVNCSDKTDDEIVEKIKEDMKNVE